MTINSKTKTFPLFDATPGLLTARSLLAAFFVLASMLQLPAQNVVLTGALSGRVTDWSGAVVPGASVVLQNLQTGVTQSAETNRIGLYQFPVLTPGFYSMAASLKGFRDAQGLVQVRIGNTTSLDVKLQVGSSADTIKVSGRAPLLRPAESSASTVLERSFIEELPLMAVQTPTRPLTVGRFSAVMNFRILKLLPSANTNFSTSLREIRRFPFPFLTTVSMCRTPSALCRT